MISLRCFDSIKRVFLGAAVSASFVFGVAAQAPATPEKDEIKVDAKILSIDPIKGDVGVRLEFTPDGKFAKDDGTLAKTVKLDINSSNGKQEVTFDRGKRMTPTEAVLNMFDSAPAQYPFDTHRAAMIFWFSVKPDKAAAEKPKTEGETASPDAPKADANPADAEEMNDDGEVDVPFTLEFKPEFSGYTIESAKSKDSDDTYVDVEMTFSRAPMVKFFSIFVMVLMILSGLVVLALAGTVVIGGRKPELAMFSFIAALIFAFVALRNAQPAVPPVGTLSDYIAFFPVEAALSICLLSVVTMWVARPAGKA